MSTYRVPKCGRHFVKFDDVTIYPVLVVARTVNSFFRSFGRNFRCKRVFKFLRRLKEAHLRFLDFINLKILKKQERA